MKEKPILFSSEMVRAILYGKKTQTRRVIKPQPERDEKFYGGMAIKIKRETVSLKSIQEGIYKDICPYGKPGDRLWVRETWKTEERKEDGLDGIRYKADNAFVWIENTSEAADNWINASYSCGRSENWKPSIFMPRWASRINLELTNVRVERVKDISNADAQAEGVGWWRTVGGEKDYCLEYSMLWDRINGEKFRWSSNPWVWVLEFRSVEL